MGQGSDSFPGLRERYGSLHSNGHHHHPFGLPVLLSCSPSLSAKFHAWQTLELCRCPTLRLWIGAPSPLPWQATPRRRRAPGPRRRLASPPHLPTHRRRLLLLLLLPGKKGGLRRGRGCNVPSPCFTCALPGRRGAGMAGAGVGAPDRHCRGGTGRQAGRLRKALNERRGAGSRAAAAATELRSQPIACPGGDVTPPMPGTALRSPPPPPRSP